LKLLRVLLIAAASLLPSASAQAGIGERLEFRAVNFLISGKLIDYTDKHGADRRIWSEALGMKRNAYVYLPPNFDPAQRYPLIVLLHGFAQDESALFYILPKLDRDMEAGRFPHSILVAPDGNIPCGQWIIKRGSFYVNSNAGRYEDYLLQDVQGFVERNFPIHPDRRARALVGVSMGGGAAFDLAIRHKDQFGVTLGIFPPLNFRYLDCNENYRGKYDPNCFMLRTRADNDDEVLAYFLAGLVKIRIGAMAKPLFGRGDDVVEGLSRFNPYENLDRYDVRPGELAMFVGYAGRDQYNIDSQIKSFLDKACERGLKVTTSYAPLGRHDTPTARRILPEALDWLSTQLAPFGPRGSCALRTNVSPPAVLQPATHREVAQPVVPGVAKPE
jgi:S-formylglutathione hydrolase FrmB